MGDRRRACRRGIAAPLADAGAAMRRSLAHDFQHVDGVDVVMTLDSRFEERHPFRVVTIDAGEELATFERLAAECDDTLVIAPETDGILADRLTRIERVGGRSLGSSIGAVELAGDKVRLAAFLEERGVPTIPTRGACRGRCAGGRGVSQRSETDRRRWFVANILAPTAGRLAAQ